MLEVLFLGTGASVPSRDRSTSCVAVRSGSDIVLLDCGEGSQRQLMISPFSFMKIRAVCITHLHGDHVFGLPGLLQTMGMGGRTEPLAVYGPAGIAKALDMFMTATEGETSYPLEVAEVSGGESLTVKGLRLEVYRTEHGIPSVGYVVRERDSPGRLDRAKAVSLGIREGPDMARLKNGETVDGVRPDQVVGPAVPGASVSYTGDTLPCGSVVDGSAGVDLLIHESTFMKSESAQALEHSHSTAAQAARAAVRCGASALVLTHVSNRYDDRGAVLAEASAVFSRSFLADDMDMFVVRHGSADRKSD